MANDLFSADPALGPALMTPGEQLRALENELNLVDQIIGHRLRQGDIERILQGLNETDRNDFTVKLADILRKTSALLEVSKRVSDSLSLDVLLPRMVELVADFLGADRATLFLYDARRKELYSRVAQGDLTQEIRFPSHLGIAGSVFTSGTAVSIDDAYQDPRFNQEVDKKTGYRTRTILCAPIRDNRGGVIGVTQVLNKNDGVFTTEDLGLLEALTQQAASALVNAQLHEDIDRVRSEESKLLELTTALSRELHLDKLLQKIMSAVTEILDADRSTLFMYDSKTRELWSHVAQGVGMAEIRFPSHLGIAGSVFTSGETINIPDAYADERFNQEVDKKTGYKTDTMLCMPVVNKKDDIIGVVQVLNKSDGPFTALDERRLAAFSSQASIAIENAQLFEEIMGMKNYQESILRSMSNGVITLSAEGEVVTANESALRLFRCEHNPSYLIGQNAWTLFDGENAWIAQTIEAVGASGKSDAVLDEKLWLKPLLENLPPGAERRRTHASVNLSTVPLDDGKGELMGTLLVIEDITSEKRIKSTMARYMSKEVADKLLEGDSEEILGGQMQEATVLFTDIRSFTSISEKLGAQETVKMLNAYFSIMVDCILDHGGILDKYIGDAIMAVFGAPIPGEADPDNAVRTAVAMIKALMVFNAERAAQGQEPILMGIGVNTDQVLSGNIGSLKRMDYTVIGDGVNLASRLEGANKPYGTQILISEMTRSQLRGDYRLREVDQMRVKGKALPVGVFEVLDYHQPQTFPHLDDLLPIYNEGLGLYRKRQWQAARECFAKACGLNANDGLSKMYQERCQIFMEKPPADDWDGVWTMTSK